MLERFPNITAADLKARSFAFRFAARAARLTSGGAKSTQDAAGELAGMAAELQRIVAVFKFARSGDALAANAAI